MQYNQLLICQSIRDKIMSNMELFPADLKSAVSVQRSEPAADYLRPEARSSFAWVNHGTLVN